MPSPPHASLAERRAATASEVEVLEREQAVAILDGLAFDARRLVECRQELDALDGAEAEATRRDRAAAESSEAAVRTQARKDLAVTLDSYLSAAERAQATTEAMVAELLVLESLAATMRREIRLVGRPGPMPIPLEETKNKHSAMLATQLRALGQPNRYGGLEWSSMMPLTDLLAHTQKYLVPGVQPYINGE
jgi:hypothetical protein